MCACGHERAYHNPCSICECPAYERRTTGAARKYPKRRTT